MKSKEQFSYFAQFNLEVVGFAEKQRKQKLKSLYCVRWEKTKLKKMSKIEACGLLW